MAVTRDPAQNVPARNTSRNTGGTSGGSSTGITFGGGSTEAADTGPREDPNSLASLEAEFGAGEFSWQEMVASRLPKDVGAWAKSIGEDPIFITTALNKQMPNLLFQLNKQIGRYSQTGAGTIRSGTAQFSPAWFKSPDGLEFIYNMALDWVAAQDQRFAGIGSGTGGGGGRGGGSRGPSPEDIRAQFDLDQLSQRANDIWFSNVLDEAPDPRGMARSYVDMIVKNPNQKVDFDTFIRKQVESTSRYKTMYKRKPPGMDAAQFIQPLFQMAQSAVGAEGASDLAVGAAQFGGDPNAFRERLGRTDEVRNSAPFMQSMENRMTEVSSVLKG